MTKDTEKLRQDMDTLLELIRLGWEKMARRPLGPREHWEIRRYIKACQDDLAALLDRLDPARGDDA